MVQLVGNDFAFGVLEGTYRQDGEKLEITASQRGTGPSRQIEYLVNRIDDSHMTLTLLGRSEDFELNGAAPETATIASLTKGSPPKPSRDAGQVEPEGSTETWKEDQSATTCLSNMKQLGTAMSLYVQDYDGVMAIANTWSDALMPYTKTRETMSCPEVQKSGSEGGFAMDASLSMITVSTIATAADTVLFFETATIGLNVSDTQTSLIGRARHEDGIHFTYADGHTGTKK